mgnify:CR=1 FL=1
MKITAIFLGAKKERLKKIENSASKALNNMSVCIYIIFAFIAFAFFVKYIKISPKIMNFATNFRQAEEPSIEVSDIFNIYGIYNKDNYVIAENNIVEKAEEKPTNPLQNAIDVIDNEAKDKTEETVFGNSKAEAVVTAENNSLQRVTLGTMKILNYSTKRDINFTSLGDSSITLTKASDKILLYNTHTSESYANSDNYKFEYTGTRRTTDANFNMLAIAKEFSENLNSKGFNAVQNTTPHDYGTYTSAYAKSRVTVQDALVNMGGASISIDVHRDAIADLDYRPVTQIKGIQVAQLMFVMGVGSDTTKNPYYEDNLKLALKIQQLADKVYPGLFKPMIVRNSVYNQDLNKYSFLVEVGATGNTIEEAKLATRCLTNLLNIIYKDWYNYLDMI